MDVAILTGKRRPGSLLLCLLLLCLITGNPGCAPQPQSHQEEGAANLIMIARKDVAEREGIPLEKVTLLHIETVEWRDTSLGCPEPGKFYAQVITPGYRIILSDGIKEYEYHSDTQNRVIFCQMILGGNLGSLE